MQEIGRVIAKYLFPVLLIVIGLLLLVTAGDQTNLYKLGSASIFIVGLVGLFFVKGVIGRYVQLGLAVVIGIFTAYVGFKNYDVIMDRLEYDRLKENVNAQVIQRLKDIRKAELAYHREFGRYTDNFDTLVDFLKNGEIRLIKRLGALPDTVPTEDMARELGLIMQMPDTLTDDQVVELGLIVRDTLYVPAGETVFDQADANTRRFPLFIDSLPYVPYGNHRFELAIATIQAGGVTQNVFQVLDPQPFEKQFIVGSLDRANTSGNWSE